MGPGYFVLAILGCGEGDASCQQVAVASTHYQSAEACREATAEAVERNQNLEFPVIVAECRSAGTKVVEQLKADEVKLPDPARRPDVRRATIFPQAPRRG